MSSEQKLIHYIQEKLLKDKTISITPQTKLFEEHLLDSMNILGLIGYIEKATNNKLNDNDLIMSNFQTVDTMIKKFKL